MARSHLVRIGALGEIGRFVALDAVCYPRGTRVVVRTGRGLEVGSILTGPNGSGTAMADGSPAPPDGQILRGMTVEDELLAARLDRRRNEAHDACQARLAERGIEAALLDVEHLFDGRTLVFYFLGPVTAELEEVTRELAEVYAAEAQFHSFAELLTHGCGPGCGTEAATGGGCTSCASGCSLASACSNRRST
ncbi:MAG TPA: PSP1 domain-containing protein [Pirellulales bacterium]|nr:PSP1 domain-containing protein [Pirellulales bacterium]